MLIPKCKENNLQEFLGDSSLLPLPNVDLIAITVKNENVQVLCSFILVKYKRIQFPQQKDPLPFIKEFNLYNFFLDKKKVPLLFGYTWPTKSRSDKTIFRKYNKNYRFFLASQFIYLERFRRDLSPISRSSLSEKLQSSYSRERNEVTVTMEKT